MRTLITVAFFATLTPGVFAQSASRYGNAAQPTNLPNISAAFDNQPPASTNPGGRAGRYGVAPSATTPPPALPSSTPVTPRSSRPVTPLPTGSANAGPATGGSATSRPAPPNPSRASAAPQLPSSLRTAPARPLTQPNLTTPNRTTPNRTAPSQVGFPQNRSRQIPSSQSTPSRFESPRAQSRPQPTTPRDRFQRSAGVTLPDSLGPVTQGRSSLSRANPGRSTFSQATSNQPTSNQPPSNRPPTASQRIMARMLQPGPGSRLLGSSVTVADVTRGARTREEQSHRVEAYWDLCASAADYYLGLREAEELRKHQRKAPGMSQALRLAEQDLRGRLETSLHAAQASQQRLASMMRTNQLPLPADAPFCGEYNTRFAEIFGSGGGSSARLNEARGLHELLPARYEELNRTVSSIARAEKLANSIASRSQGSDGKAMLRALELLALNRRAFVQLAKDYNRRIARYTELSNPGRVDNRMLVAMLVGSSERVSVSTIASLR